MVDSTPSSSLNSMLTYRISKFVRHVPCNAFCTTNIQKHMGACSVRSLSWELLSCGETLPTDTYFNTCHVSQTCTMCVCCAQYTRASIPQVHLWRLVLWAAATKGLVTPQRAPLASEVPYATSSTSCTTSESWLLVLRYFQRKCIHISQIDRFSPQDEFLSYTESDFFFSSKAFMHVKHW